MAEKRGSRTTKRAGEHPAERRTTRTRQRAERDHAAMDNPVIEDEPSDIRHAVYFIGILAFAFVLNLAVLILVSGGQ